MPRAGVSCRHRGASPCRRTSSSIGCPRSARSSPGRRLLTPEGRRAAARNLVQSWARAGFRRYEERHDDLAADGTSRLSPYLHFGCLSALDLVARLEVRRVAGVPAPTVLARLPSSGHRVVPVHPPPRVPPARTRSARDDMTWSIDSRPHQLPDRDTDAPAPRRRLDRDRASHRLLVPNEACRLDWRLRARLHDMARWRRSSPTTAATGGRIAEVRQRPRRPAFRCRCARPSVSIPTATTCAATCNCSMPRQAVRRVELEQTWCAPAWTSPR